MAHIPKAALYYYPFSVWSAVALLTLEEKGYGADEIDLRVVDLGKGENYELTYLRLNPKATVPALLVPYENSLTEDVESRYKALTETKTIVEFLEKSRSPLSRTQTTSRAPAPSLTPATIAATMSCKIIIDELLHSDSADPNQLKLLNAKDEAGLKVLASELLPALKERERALRECVARADGPGAGRVSEKVRGLWREKMEAIGGLIRVLSEAGTETGQLSEEGRRAREVFLARAKMAWEKAGEVLVLLSKEMVGPYALGDQFSIADLHLAGWFTRVVHLAGGTAGDDGKTVVGKLEARIGIKLARDYVSEQATREKAGVEKQAKLAVFWDEIKERASWKKVYGQDLLHK